MPTKNPTIRKADTRSIDPLAAVAELDRDLDFAGSALTVLFCSPNFDLDSVGQEIAKRSDGAPVMGCSSAGEIGSNGYLKGAISGFSFGRDDFKVAVERVDELTDFSTEKSHEISTRIRENLARQGVENPGKNCFGFLLVDGLSIMEEQLVFKLQESLGEIPIIGGSAGDNLDFMNTYVYSDGQFSTNTAVLAVVHSKRPWEVFKEQHYTPTDKKVLITGAVPHKRLVTEINCEPAALELARLIGVDGVEDLTPSVLGQNPLMLMLGGNWYIRSVAQVNTDNSLTLYCAIEDGLVLSLGEPHRLLDELAERFSQVRDRIGEIQLTIACDCIMRRLELESKNLIHQASEIFRRNQTVGFSTYGEQYGAVHVNQTLTAIAIA